MDLHGPEHYIHAFDYPSMNYRQSWAPKGEGPEELLGVENIRMASGKIWTLDANKEKVIAFPLNSKQQERQISLSKQLIRTLDFDFYNDSMLIVPDYTGKYRFSLLNMNGEVYANKGKILVKKQRNKPPAIALAQAWRSFLSYNSENGILALATQLGDVVEIYDMKQGSPVKVVYGHQGEPKFRYASGYAIPEGIMGYSDIFVGKELIYALFCGHTMEDIRRQAVKVQGGNFIRVLDLNGEPVKEYILDRYITGFYIDEDKNKIIGLDVNSDQPVVEFELRTEN
jgi:hypothetical protein